MVRQIMLSDQDLLVDLSVSVCCQRSEPIAKSKSRRHADPLNEEALRDIARLAQKVM
jgi:hypothetical protein